MDQDATWYGSRPRSTRLCVRWGPRSPPQKGIKAPNYRLMFIVVKRLHGSSWHLHEVGLSPGDFVLDGHPAPSPKGGEPHPQFSAHFYCGQTAGCIKMPLGTEVGLGLRDIVLDGDPATPSLKGHRPPPIFGQCPLWPNGWMD